MTRNWVKLVEDVFSFNSVLMERNTMLHSEQEKSYISKVSLCNMCLSVSQENWCSLICTVNYNTRNLGVKVGMFSYNMSIEKLI